MALLDLVKPSKTKVLASLLVSALLLALLFIFPNYVTQRLLSRSPGELAADIILNIGLFTLLYYPFSCGLIFFCGILKGWEKRRKAARSEYMVALLLVLVMNPLTLSLFYMRYMAPAPPQTAQTPCGMEVVGFNDLSPAREAGVQTGEVIASVEGRETKDVQSFMAVLEGKRPKDTITVKTDRGGYNITLEEEPASKKPVMGIKVREKSC